MAATLTYFQGLILKVVGELGSTTIAEIGRRTHNKLEKNCQYTGSTIADNVKILVEMGFLARESRTAGNLHIPTVYYVLTAKGRNYIATSVS